MVNPYNTAFELLEALRDGEVSALELTDMYLDRIDATHDDLNSVIWQRADEAREEAKAITSPPDVSKPLLGLPITVKEAYNVVGAPTTWGKPEFRNNISTEDALAVERLREAGAIVIGKTNVPLDLADIQSYNEIYGTSNNPYNLAHTPGGSSGGSGAAMAAGLSALEMGSDIGGSIRTPAHFCGIFGHKPTWGLIPSRGHALPGGLVEPDIAVIGPMARSAIDLELQLDILAKPDHINPGLRYELAGLPDTGFAGLRVAVWDTDEACPVSAETRARVRSVAATLADAGASVDYDARPTFTGTESDAIYTPLLWSFMNAFMPEEAYEDMKAQAANLAPDDDSQEGAIARLSTMDHRTWLGLHNEREGLRWAWHTFFQDYDVVLAPQTSTPAIAHDHRPLAERSVDVDGIAVPYLQQCFWAGLIGISHLPSTVIPTGLGEAGLPIGVQIVGNAYSDRLTIQVAQGLEKMGFRFRPPEAFPA
ncbi:MAG: amidase [Pseudomonadales bacterium]|jgi:amidase|nr:amidase [Pseudomonadales bacterium]MDP6469844.1 amidase [Pseudomonadales bacterium]MDP6827554.1 amidase [Pseudomonadales bacterium]MDP6971314.1 amidase [Pseudomonadales bacterium]|tara:strand:+ start:633 stop:2072 length:1440 start_codon:yes stop_codon:yes gene_type:complete